MPHGFRVYLDLKGEGSPGPEHLRAFASNVFERGIDTDHQAHVKPYTIGRCTPVTPAVWAIDLTVATDLLADALTERLVSGTGVFLGPLRGTVLDGPVLVVSRTWGDLADAPPVSGAQFSFDTPVVYVHQKEHRAEPTGQRIFGHLRRRWRNLDPDTAQDVSFEGIEFDVDLHGSRIAIQGAGPRDIESGRAIGRKAVGFVGTATVSISGATIEDRFALGALANAAPFLGSGAWTTAGFGATSLVVVWVDD